MTARKPWPVDIGQPDAAHAASEIVDERDDGIAAGVILWPVLMVLAGVVVGVLMAVFL